MSGSYSTALTHGLSGAVGFYCWYRIGTKQFFYQHGCFAFIAINSVFGIIRHGTLNFGDNFKSVYELTSLLETSFTLPILSTTLYMRYGYSRTLAICNIAISFIPLTMQIDSVEAKSFAELALIINFFVLTIVSYNNSNIWGILSAVMMNICHFKLKDQNDINVEPQAMYNIGICLYCYFAFNTIREITLNEIVQIK